MRIFYHFYFKSKFIYLLCILFFVFHSCDNSKSIEDDVVAFQATIDSLLVGFVVPMKTALAAEISENNSLGKDTFQLARQKIPITRVQFLVSDEYFKLDEALKAYATERINSDELLILLEKSRLQVDSLIRYDLMHFD
jgi:hypothetical protein